ncbi:hypothetical protein ACFL27_23680 [candidate division CSSED10-310 bacterium]|uniref:YfhO family protein n=1 Tax=candidate division CSSED10-310 bacterium TaxID=2855610 RepID=A0ABV6Z433_UNCC1
MSGYSTNDGPISQNVYKLLNLKTIFALLFFLLVPFIYTYPLPFEFTTHVAGFGDVWQHLWNLWWFHNAIMNLQNPLITDNIYYPIEVSLAFHSYSYFNMILGFFFQKGLSLATVYNILILKSLILSGITAFVLCWYLTGSRSAGLIGGTVWAYSSYHISRIMFLHLFSLELIPIYCYFLFRSKETQRRIYAIGAGFFLCLVALCSWYYLVFMVIVTVIEAIFFLKVRHLKLYGVIILSCVVFLLPFIYTPLELWIRGESYMNVTLGMTKIFSADLLSFFVPSEKHPLLSTMVSPFYATVHTHFTERNNYLGILVCLLFATFIFSRKILRAEHPEAESAIPAHGSAFVSPPGYIFHSDHGNLNKWKHFLTTIFMGGVLLSLGPVLQVNGQVYDFIHLPFFYLRELPLFSAMRAPHRFLAISVLALSVGGACGWLSWQRFIRKLGSSRSYSLSCCLIIVLILLDFWCFFPFPTSVTSKYPPFYDRLAAHSDQSLILDIPLPQQDYSLPMFYQTIHHKKIFGGYISRPPVQAEKFIDEHPFLDFARSGRLSITDGEAINAHYLLTKFPITYLILHKKYLPAFSQETLMKWALNYFDDPLYQDEDITVFLTKLKQNSDSLSGLNLVIPPITLPVCLCRNKSNGKIVVNEFQGELMKEWVLWENGSVSQQFCIARAGNYKIVVVARGTAAQGIFPKLTVSIDSSPIATNAVRETLGKLPSAMVTLEPGIHEISLTYDNDFCSYYEDRNVYLFTISLTPVPL